MIFVFGSNITGRHSKGAALKAMRHHGAKRGVGYGHEGQSFAIPTKDEHLKVLPLAKINGYVRLFLEYAEHHPELEFRLTPVGCGLAGYAPEQIAPMFDSAPVNVILPHEFMLALGRFDEVAVAPWRPEASWRFLLPRPWKPCRTTRTRLEFRCVLSPVPLSCR
jgi:hypothetical protein